MDPTKSAQPADPPQERDGPEPPEPRAPSVRPRAGARSRMPAAHGPRQLMARLDPPSDAEDPSLLDVEAAMEEIARVPAAAIHRVAAYAWASRAIAGYRVCLGHGVLQEGLTYLYLGEHYREAALAHAAMGEAWQPLYSEIDRAMAKDRAQAFASMRHRSAEAGR